jgi:hypothetical protein
VALQGLSISIGKNSALFVKLNNGLIGVKDWYGNAPSGTRRRKQNGAPNDGDDKDDHDEQHGDEQAQPQADGQDNGGHQ